jgi:hypothetical protein
MRNRTVVARTIDEILIPYADCVAWGDYGPKGNLCWNPYDYESVAEEEEAAYTLAAVELEMGKYSKRHKDLAKKVAKQTGNEYVTYPWLRDAVSRLLAGTTYEELLLMSRLSMAVKVGMQAKGLKEIHSIEEALS